MQDRTKANESVAEDAGEGDPQDARVQEAATGDRDAAESLLAELLPRIRNLIRYLVRGDKDVEDISQEALVTIYRKLGSYRGEGRFQGWVDRIVVRTTFEWLRRQRKRTDAPMNEEPRDLGIADAQTEEYLTRRAAVRHLDQLPDAQRQALVLHHALGMTVPEIAGELGISAETVRSRMRLGRNRLRDIVSGSEQTP